MGDVTTAINCCFLSSLWYTEGMSEKKESTAKHWSEIPPSKRTKAQLLEWARHLETETLVSVNTRLPKALRDDVKKESHRREMKMQDVFAEALQLWLATEPDDEPDDKDGA